MKIKNLKKIILLSSPVFIGAGIYIVYNFNPASSKIYPPCLFHLLTGLYCPGCGTARAMYALVHGRFIDALRNNIFAVFSLPFIIYSYIIHYFRELFPNNKIFRKDIFIKPVLIKILVIFIILFWILRNIPVIPFTYLAPL